MMAHIPWWKANQSSRIALFNDSVFNNKLYIVICAAKEYGFDSFWSEIWYSFPVCCGSVGATTKWPNTKTHKPIRPTAWQEHLLSYTVSSISRNTEPSGSETKQGFLLSGSRMCKFFFFFLSLSFLQSFVFLRTPVQVLEIMFSTRPLEYRHAAKALNVCRPQ